MPTALQRSRDILAQGVARVRSGLADYARHQDDTGPPIKVEPFDAHNVSTPAALIKLGTSIAAARRERANYEAAKAQLTLDRAAASDKATLEGDKTRAEIAKLRAEASFEEKRTVPVPVVPQGQQIVPSGRHKGKTYAQAALDNADERLKSGGEDPFAPLDNVTLRMAALNYAKGGGLPPLGNSKQAAPARMDIMRYAAHHFPALDVRANKADMEANAAALKDSEQSLQFAKSYGDQLDRNAETVKSIIGKIPDTGAQWSNAIVRSVLPQITSGSNIPEYNAAVEFVGIEAAKLLTGNPATGAGQLSDQAKKEIRAVVNHNYTKRDMLGVLGILARDKENRIGAYSGRINELRDRMSWNEFGAQPRFTPGGASNDEQPQPTQADLEYVKSLGIK